MTPHQFIANRFEINGFEKTCSAAADWARSTAQQILEWVNKSQYSAEMEPDSLLEASKG